MEGAIAALRESGRANEVMLVVNELIDELREALQDGTVKIVIGYSSRPTVRRADPADDQRR